MAAYNAASTSVPLMNMGSYQTFTKSEGITNRFARVAIPIFDRVVGFRDLLALALTYHLFHLGLSTRDASTGTAADKCAVSSWLMISMFATLMVIIVVSNVWRVLNAFNAWAEVLLGLLYVLIAIVIAGGTGPHRWALAQGAQDVCSAASSPAAQSAYWLSDIIGTGSILLISIIVLAKPFLKDLPVVSLLVLVVVAILLQALVIDEFLVPEISTIWQTVEANGTVLDDDFLELENRVGEIESTFNITIR
jgi:hypothetical protein